MSNIKLAVDGDAETAYITLSSEPIVRTVEHNECVLVDLDAMNIAVGVELLDLDATIPFEELTTTYHVHTDVVDILRLIQPTINKFVFKSKSTDGRVEDHEESRADTGTLQAV